MERGDLKTDYSVLVYLALEEKFGQIGKGYFKKQCLEIGVDPFEIQPHEVKRVAARMSELYSSLGHAKESHRVRERIEQFLVLEEEIAPEDKRRLRAKLLIDVGEFYFLDPLTRDKARPRFDEALELLKGSKGEEQLFRIHKLEGDAFAAREQYDEAIVSYTSALENSENTSDRYDVLRCGLGLGSCYWRKANHVKAKEVIGWCLDFAQRLQPDVEGEDMDAGQASIAQAYNMLGNIDVDLGDYDAALGNLDKARKIYHKLEDHVAEGLIYNNLGTVYDDMPQQHLPPDRDKWREAIKEYEKGIALLKKGHEPRELAYYVRILANASRAYSWCNDLPRSKRLVEEANALLDQIYDKIDGAKMLRSIVEFGYAVHYQNRKPVPDFETAIRFYEKSIVTARESGARDYLHRSHHELGRMYILMGKKDMARKHLTIARDGYGEDRQGRRVEAVQRDLDAIASIVS